MDWNLDRIPLDHPTPSVIVSKEVALANIASLQAYCDQHGIRLRPHTKTHKSRWMATAQLQAGAKGLTVAKVGEAEIMADVCEDILIAYPPVGSARLKRLAHLAKSKPGVISVAVDSMEAASQIQEAMQLVGAKVGVLVDIEVGFHRTGVENPQYAIALSKFIASQPHLDFLGLMCFPGHILPDESDGKWNAYEQSLVSIDQALENDGIQVAVVSGGSTPTARESHRNEGLTEIRPGTYIYNDFNEVKLGVCNLEEVAARILATVVSRPTRNKVVVDAGSKTMSSDRNAGDPNCGFGFLPDYPNSKVVRLSEEHGEIEFATKDLPGGQMPAIGDRIWIIPNHICVAINLQNEFYMLDDGNELVRMPVDARGLLT